MITSCSLPSLHNASNPSAAALISHIQSPAKPYIKIVVSIDIPMIN